MLQILIVYYGPGLLLGLPLLPRFTAALATFVINYACYFSEIYRGGIQSIPRGLQEVEAPEQGGLAAARGADDGQGLALVQGKADVPEDLYPAEAGF